MRSRFAAGIAEDVAFPFAVGVLGGLVPAIADDDVELAVLVDIGDADAFGAEVAVEDDFLPGDFGGLLVLSVGIEAEERTAGKRRTSHQKRFIDCPRYGDSFSDTGSCWDYGDNGGLGARLNEWRRGDSMQCERNRSAYLSPATRPSRDSPRFLERQNPPRFRLNFRLAASDFLRRAFPHGKIFQAARVGRQHELTWGVPRCRKQLMEIVLPRLARPLYQHLEQFQLGRMSELQFTKRFEKELQRQHHWLAKRGIEVAKAAVAIHAAVIVLSLPGLRSEAKESQLAAGSPGVPRHQGGRPRCCPELRHVPQPRHQRHLAGWSARYVRISVLCRNASRKRSLRNFHALVPFLRRLVHNMMPGSPLSAVKRVAACASS